MSPVKTASAFLLVLGTIAPGSALGRTTVELEMEARPTRLALGDQTHVSVTVKVGSQASTGILGGPSFRDYRPPGLDDFEILRNWTSTSTQLSIVGGRAHREEIFSYQYVVRPRKAGRLLVSPAQVSFKGRTHSSNAITIQVDQGAAAPAPTLPGQAPNLKDDDEIFIQVMPDKPSAFVGEQVTVTWYLYTRTSLARQPEIKITPNTDPFFAEDLPYRTQEATRTTINGTIYAVLPIYRRALFPLKEGRLRVGPMTVEAMTVGQSYYSLTPVQRSSAEVFVEAKPLPQAGRPADFVQGNVGRYSVSAEVDPPQIDARSATSLRLTVSGQGFIHGLKVEAIQHLPGFRVRFAGQKTEMGQGIQLSGTRVNEYVLIPEQTGTLKVPPICFPHFDPARGTYVTDACSKALSVHVTGQLPTADTVSAGQDNELRRALKPILHGGALIHRSPWRWHRSPWRWPVLLLPVVAVLGLLAFRRLQARRAQDTEGRLRREARTRARGRLRLASSALRASDRVVFFGEISNVLQDQLSARLGVRVRGLTSPELERVLSESGLPANLSSRIFQTLEECDLARFAPAAATDAEMHEVFSRTKHLLDSLDRARISRREKQPEDATA
ncbi:MAG: BatD family protein [Polyangia bacterium]|nr:BatD family protein [Polyangia bacterium]